MLFLALLILIALLVLLFTPILPMRRRRGGVAGFPFVTVGLLAINTIVFLGSMSSGEEFIRQWALVPNDLQLASLLSYAFLHGDIFHLLGNLITLYVIGVHVEEALGNLPYLLAYLAGALVAGLGHAGAVLLFFPGSAGTPMVGASGAIFCVLGLFAVRFWRTRVRLFWIPAVPAAVAVGIVMVLQIFMAIRSLVDHGADQVAYAAHLIGFFFGFGIAFPLRVLEQSAREYGIEDAEKALAAGDLTTAAGYYRELLVRTPTDGGLAHTLALVHVRLGEQEAAHRYFTQALDLFSKQGNAAAVARIYSDAQTNLLRVSLPVRLLQRVASACEDAQQYELARQALANLCRDFTHTTDAELGMLKLGKLHLQKLGQRDNALAIFAEFLRLYPTSEWANHVRGLITENQNAS
ncbi:rhomboid family intramembrane serine protease [Armatimonas sp.]|uniref:rhomboid family intramembrane serine protease n=1 Tax=Armatimonas sp. TaxID=1872638 RepID=UPI00286C12AE|nr:rhomboid family intramembrane serine protease [Armatimonas sp.]